MTPKAVEGRIVQPFRYPVIRPNKVFGAPQMTVERLDEISAGRSIFTPRSADCIGCLGMGAVRHAFVGLVYAMKDIKWADFEGQQHLGVKRWVFSWATGCLEVVNGSNDTSTVVNVFGPKGSIGVIHNSFSDSASNMYGAMGARFVETGAGFMREPGIEVSVKGDGALEIGMTSESGWMQNGRGISIWYPNGGFMNTGKQRSRDTWLGADRATSPVGEKVPGNVTFPWNLIQLAAAHNVPFAATASVYRPFDLYKKMQIAASVRGPAVIILDSPCPQGQGFSAPQGLKVAEMAVETGIFPLVSFFGANTSAPRWTIDYLRNEERGGGRIPVTEFFRTQKGLRHLAEENYAAIAQRIQAEVDRRYGEHIFNSCLEPDPQGGVRGKPRLRFREDMRAKGLLPPTGFLPAGVEPEVRDLWDF